MAALRASLMYDIDPRHRHRLLRRLALGMETRPPRTLNDALAYAWAAVLQLEWIANEGGLSSLGLAESTALLHPIFATAPLPAWTPILPYCAGGYGERPPPPLLEEATC